MTSKPLRRLKPILYPLIFFFCWTNLGIYNLAYAASSSQKSGVSSQKKNKTTDEKFQESLERIREGVDKEDVAKLKTEKAEIEKLDTEIKNQFKATEEKIKNLPEEIKKRHSDFVKKYEENLKELKTNLDEIEKAKTKTEKQQAHQKAKDFLEKKKPPSKHTPLDPNKLPHRTPEIKKKEPRTKPEEFKEEKAENSGRVGYAHYKSNRQQKPILVASNGPLTGLLSALPMFSPSPLAGEGWGEGLASDYEPSATSLLVAAATNLPTPADLSETIEVQFTDEIKAKAQELNNNPVKIYEWVRNNIEYVPTYGSIQGADMCLRTKQCNDFDTASLLIALLRASNISARYVYGTIELPIEKVMNWVGGFTDSTSAVNFIASGGVPIKAYTSGGKIAKVQMEHVWVEGWSDYIPSRGAVHKQGDTWIPLDASFKQYTYKMGMDLYSSLSFNGDQFMNGYIADSQEITPYQQYGKQMLTWLDANMPSASIEDVLGAQDIPSTKVIVQQTFPYLLGTLPYKVVVQVSKYSTAPDTLRHKVTLQISADMFGEGGFSVTKTLPELSGKRITLSYIPATSSDESLVTQYGGDMLNVPPYLLNVKPVLKIDGNDAATGGSVGIGSTQSFTMNLYTSASGSDIVQNNVIAGTYSAIVIQPQKSVVELSAQRMKVLTQNSKILDQPNISLDDLLGEMLNNIGVSYFYHLADESDFYAKTFNMINLKLPSEGIVTADVSVAYLFGVPRSVTEGGINIDVDRDISVPFSLTGDNNARVKDFMILAGMSASAWEHLILEAFYDIPSVSAVNLLKLASQQGIPIYQIDSQNIAQILPLLTLSNEVQSDIQNAVNAGKSVTISQTNVQLNNWVGVGYITLNPATGAAAYLISGGLAGGGTSGNPALSPRDKASYIERIIGTVKRHIVLLVALLEVGTPYHRGGKDPKLGYFDCSGLVAYTYAQIGINELGTIKSPKDAQMQYDYVASINGLTNNPLRGDIVFFQGTYDKNGDRITNNEDGVTHVGIYYGNNQYIAAQESRGVNIYLLSNDPKNGNWGQDHFTAYGIVIP